MILPLKYRAVNWVDGMKISSDHFVQTDNFIQDAIRDSNSLSLNTANYGLLPPFSGEQRSLDIQINERPANGIQIKIKQCNAITAEGYRVLIMPGTLGEEMIFDHYFSNEAGAEGGDVYYVVLTVDPHQRVAAGKPNAEELPLRYPYVDSHYGITILSASQINARSNNYLEVGKFIRNGAGIQLIKDYIPPSTSIISYPELIRYYEHFSHQLNEFQLLSFRIIDKITSKDNISTIGKNVKSLCDKMLDFIARIYFPYRNIVHHQPPILLVSYFSEMAHVFFSTIKSMAGNEREELLKYFYEWKDVTPGNFEELLAKLIEIVYNHHDISTAMLAIDEFTRVLLALWNKLSTLEYIGQRKENIVVAEQQVVQAVQAKRTWTLLD